MVTHTRGRAVAVVSLHLPVAARAVQVALVLVRAAVRFPHQVVLIAPVAAPAALVAAQGLPAVARITQLLVRARLRVRPLAVPRQSRPNHRKTVISVK